jgi:hypothetical protein
MSAPYQPPNCYYARHISPIAGLILPSSRFCRTEVLWPAYDTESFLNSFICGTAWYLPATNHLKLAYEEADVSSVLYWCKAMKRLIPYHE